MAVTRLKRKDRRNKTVALNKKQIRKERAKKVFIKSPFKGVSGIIIEE